MLENILRHLPATILRLDTDPADPEEIRLQKTLLSFGGIMIVLATILWGVVYMVFDEPLAAWISLIYALAAGLTIFVFDLARRKRPILDALLLLGLLFPFIQMIVLGGFRNSSAVVLWSLISPVAVLLLYGPNDARRWLVAYLVLLILSGFLEPYVRTRNNLPAYLVDVFFVMNIAAVSTIAFVTIMYFINRKNDVLRRLRIEEQKSENLLLNILPREIAAILRNEKRTIADQFEEASILFADLVGFTPLTAQMPPVEVVNLLNDIFSYFDSLVEKYDLEKIRTIGDNYMVAAGVPRPRSDHAKALARLAIDMNGYITNRPSENGQRILFRIGINSGPVIGGVIGHKKFTYDIWGDAVNVASRMESQGMPGKIQVTRATYELIEDQFVCKPRGLIHVKGWGEMETWYLEGVKT